MDDPLPPNLVPCFEAFFAHEHTRTPGQDVYQAIFDDNTLFPLQRQRELATMMQIARGLSPKVVYEIGADKGGGLYHWCKCLPTVEKVICCEYRGTPYSDLFEKTFPHIQFLWLPQSSYAVGTVRHVRAWLGSDRIDALFIDGDKSHFFTDFERYLPMMQSHGVIFMHDIQDPAPSEAFTKVRRLGFKTRRVVDITDAQEAVARQEAGEPCASAHEGWLRHWRGASAGVGVIQVGEIG